MAQRILDEQPPAQRELLVIREPSDSDSSIHDSSDDGAFVPLASTGELAMVTDTSGRAAPAHLVAAAERYTQASGSPVPAFELALAAANDDQLRSTLLTH